MKKGLKIIGCAGLLTGVILVAKKLDPSIYGLLPEKPLVAGVKAKMENLADHVEHVVRFRYPAHDGPFTDTERMRLLQEMRDAFAAAQAAKKDDDVPNNINYVENPEDAERVFTLGTNEGELTPFSDEYKVVIESAYEKSLEDDKFTLRFFGSTYGIGTRGHEQEDGSKVFAKDDIAKLKNKLAK
jgi:hypothetical protein